MFPRGGGRKGGRKDRETKGNREGRRARGEFCSLLHRDRLCYTAICYARREAQQEFMAWRHGQGARSHPSSGPSSWRLPVFAHSPRKHLMQTHPCFCLPHPRTPVSSHNRRTYLITPASCQCECLDPLKFLFVTN